jgi:hypothetical protein
MWALGLMLNLSNSTPKLLCGLVLRGIFVVDQDRLINSAVH